MRAIDPIVEVVNAAQPTSRSRYIYRERTNHGRLVIMQEEEEKAVSTRDSHHETYGAIATEDERSSIHSDDAQRGVKGIEAVSSTWSKWSLLAAYLG
jgi:hypothetical protein